MKLLQKKFPEIFLSAFCTASLLVLFYFWKRSQTELSGLSFLAALLSLVLFTAIGIVFVFRWFSDFKRSDKTGALLSRTGITSGSVSLPKDAGAPGSVFARAGKVFFLILLVDLAVIVFIALLRFVFGYREPFFEGLNFWKCLDSQHYLFIAEHGYAAEGEYGNIVRIVFLPGYPLLVKLVAFAVRNYLAAGLLVSGICFAAAGAFLYLLMRLDYDHETAVRAVKFLCLFPGAFFFTAPMSESLFLFTTLAAVYFARRKRWLAASCFGFYAAFTRSLGILVIIPVVYELLRFTLIDRPCGVSRVLRRVRDFMYSLLIPCGFGAYCLINYLITGDALRFLQYQKEHWGQEISFFFNTASYEIKFLFQYFEEGKDNIAVGLWGMGLFAFFGALVLLLIGAGKLRQSYLGYSLVYFSVAMGATWLLSGPRYMAGLFTLPIVLALSVKKRRSEEILTIALVVVYVVYSIMFIHRWQVW